MKKRGISLIVLIVIIVIILILSTAIIMGVITNNPISNAKEAVLRNDLQVMKEAYGLKTGELLLKYGGDTSKITVEDYKDVVNEKYKGEVEVFEEGLAYLGKDKKKQKVAEEMGYIIGDPNDSVLKSWGWNTEEEFHAEEYRTKITKIKFITSNKVPDNVIESWDVSKKNNGAVMAWIVDDGENGYELTIGGNKKIIANANSYWMFQKFNAVKEIDIRVLDTRNAVDMSGMFSECESLTSLDVSNFDTSNVTRMNHMFSGCKSLKNLDVSNFNTSKVTNMWLMFGACNSLTSLDLSNFDTSQSKTMWQMFQGCESLTSLNISNFDTSQSTNISFMFRDCKCLTSIDVSSFDTSSATNMAYMFQGCSNLVNINVSNFDTSNVTSMRCMFADCESLTSLDVRNFNTSQVTDMALMFCNCNNLTDIDLSGFNTSQVTDIGQMLQGCSKIKTSITIMNGNMSEYKMTFFGAATDSEAQIIVNYTSETEELVDNIINTKTVSSHVIKGEEISI